MSEQLVKRFIDGLHKLERTKDPETLLSTYAEESETSNVASERTFTGKEGARDFWMRYRGSFGEMNSEFRNVIVGGDRAALEWTTEGTGPNGDPFGYDGVSILEMAGEGDATAVTRFRAFFDSAHLGRQIAPDAKAPAGNR
jgi:ketosteroid isomerase-like protein